MTALKNNEHLTVKTQRPSSRLYPRSLTAPVARLQNIQTRFLNNVQLHENSSDIDIAKALQGGDKESPKWSAITYAAVISGIRESKKPNKTTKRKSNISTTT